MSTTYFFSKNSPLSNFYPCIFFDDNHVRYSSTEQYFHSHKALYFKDKRSYERIMRTTNPFSIKRLGRKVTGFNERKWSSVRREIMFDGCMLKFKTHDHLSQRLLKTKRTIVEANPYDKYWGPPLNNMGRILMLVRAKILCDRSRKK